GAAVGDLLVDEGVDGGIAGVLQSVRAATANVEISATGPVQRFSRTRAMEPVRLRRAGNRLEALHLAELGARQCVDRAAGYGDSAERVGFRIKIDEEASADRTARPE